MTDLSACFFRYLSESSNDNARYYGTGLGVAISHNLAKIMKGEIQVRSQLGQGETFRLIIPGRDRPKPMISKRVRVR